MPVPQANIASPHQRTLLRDIAQQRIQEAILDGTLEAGEILHDVQLQEWLGVSRTPIREAFNELARMGLVEMAPNRYTRVAIPSEKDVLNAMTTLGTLLGGVMRHAIPVLDDETAHQLASQVTALENALRHDDVQAMRTLMWPLFKEYINRCGNPLLIEVCHGSVDGLAYKTGVKRIAQMLNLQEMADGLTVLAQATTAREPITAELAVEAIFQLPGHRPTSPQ